MREVRGGVGVEDSFCGVCECLSCYCWRIRTVGKESTGTDTLGWVCLQMGKGAPKKSSSSSSRSTATSSTEETEHLLGLLVSLFTNLPSSSPSRFRLLSKFIEGSYEKVDRLLELRDEAEGRLMSVERAIDEERKAGVDGEEEEEEREEMFYLRRLEGGLFMLQMVDYVLGWLIMEDDGVRPIFSPCFPPPTCRACCSGW